MLCRAVRADAAGNVSSRAEISETPPSCSRSCSKLSAVAASSSARSRTGLVDVDRQPLGDAGRVVVEQITRIDLLDQLPELASCQRLRVERNQPVGQQQCCSGAVR